MARIFARASDLIGSTPLVALHAVCKAHDVPARVLAKLECMNPAGSAKDRAARNMIEEAERTGQLKPGGTIIEPTSGNTGIGLASVAVPRGYRVILTMPETMSLERRRLIAAYGAEIVLTSGAKGMQGAVEQAQALHKEIAGSILAGQFDNPANPAAHYKTTGPEIWQDTDGQVDAFVAGIGTGGTISGAGRYLKERKPNLHIMAVEPADPPCSQRGKQVRIKFRESVQTLYHKRWIGVFIMKFLQQSLRMQSPLLVSLPEKRDCWWEFLEVRQSALRLTWQNVRNMKERQLL